MKAYVLHGINDFAYEEVALPALQEEDVLVSVKATGVCGSDIPRIYRDGTYSYPLIPGHEFSGLVAEAGSEANVRWIGKRVGIFPLIPCQECISCKQKKYEMCKKYSYLGSRTDGGFAEYVRVPVWNLIELPDDVSYEQAAMLEPMAVASHAIRKGHVQTTDQVVVCGLGTIGLFVVMFLQEMGCRNVLVVGNKDFQKDMVVKLGISSENVCDARFEDVEQWILNKTEHTGADVFFDCVGRNEVLTWGIECASPEGVVMLVGNPAADVRLDKAVYWKVLRKQLHLIGVWNSSFTHSADDDWNYVLSRLKEKKIAPERLITHRMPLDGLEQGFHIMRDKSEDYIKVIVNFSDN